MQAGYPGDGRSRVIASVALVALATAGSAMAQAWPAKPIRIIVPYAPGGPFDEVARILSQRMNESWGQPVMVENRSGAGGSIAAELVARSAPDGYTLLHGNAGPITINPSLMRKVGYDPVRDFAPVSLLLTSAMVLVVHPSLPVRSVADLVRLARAHPGELNYASAGIGNLQHLGMESLQAMAGIRMNHVPYKGAAPAFVDIFGGRIGLMFANVVGCHAAHQGGQAARGGGVLGEAHGKPARRACGRGELSRLRHAGVDGHPRGGGNTAGHRRAAERGVRADHAASGGAPAPDRAGGRSGGRLARGSRGADRARTRTPRLDHPQFGHSSRVNGGAAGLAAAGRRRAWCARACSPAPVTGAPVLLPCRSGLPGSRAHVDARGESGPIAGGGAASPNARRGHPAPLADLPAGLRLAGKPCTGRHRAADRPVRAWAGPRLADRQDPKNSLTLSNQLRVRGW